MDLLPKHETVFTKQYALGIERKEAHFISKSWEAIVFRWAYLQSMRWIYKGRYIWDSILSETFVRLDFFPPLPTCGVKAPALSVIWSANVRSIKINSGSSIHMKYFQVLLIVIVWWNLKQTTTCWVAFLFLNLRRCANVTEFTASRIFNGALMSIFQVIDSSQSQREDFWEDLKIFEDFLGDLRILEDFWEDLRHEVQISLSSYWRKRPEEAVSDDLGWLVAQMQRIV